MNNRAYRRRIPIEKRGRVLAFFGKNWWVIAFMLIAYGIYFQAQHKKLRHLRELSCTADRLNERIDRQEAMREELSCRIKSQDDPEWIELVLKEKLGLVPEGETKVIFHTRD